ncbi:MAG: MoaD/ThiS family protein [Deltaproteobacteria bacterium]|nr:MoaD/ThiS family protein [Deltaproteobacteria bacterium]
MKIKLKLFANLRKYINESDRGICTLEIPDASKVQDVFTLLNIPGDLPTIILINGNQHHNDEALSDGDTLSLFPPIAGGNRRV